MAKKKPATQATVNNITGDTSNPADNKRRQAAIDNQPLCTVNLSDVMAPLPDVNGSGKDATVVNDKGEEVLVDYYLSNLDDTILVQHNICIGRASQAFKEFFATHVEWITELRSRIPARGRGCKIAIVHPDGTTKTYTWSEFCREFYGVSADWVRKLSKMYAEMHACPNPPEKPEEQEDEPSEPEEDNSPEAVQRRLEEKTERAERQADNLLYELGNIISLIEKHKDEVPEEVYKSAMAAKLRALPPIPAGRGMDVKDESFERIGTDELVKQIDAVLAKPAETPADDQSDVGEFPSPKPRRSRKSKVPADGE